MAHSTENFETPFHSWLDFDITLVCIWGLIFRAPAIQLFCFLYTPSIHEIVEKCIRQMFTSRFSHLFRLMQFIGFIYDVYQSC